MFRWLFVAVGILSFGSLVTAQNAEQDVSKAVQARAEARRTGDGAAHARLVADDLFHIGATGSVLDKKAATSLPASPTFAVRDVKTRMYGDVAIVYGIQDGTQGDVRFTHVWQRRNGQWMNVFVHNTPILSAPPSNTSSKPNELRPTTWPKLSNADEQAVIEAHRKLQDTFAQKDAKGYAAVSTADFVRIGELGQVNSAQEFLKAVAGTPEQKRAELIDHRDFRVRTHGQVAVLTWLNIAAQNTIRRSRIFVKEGGTWKQAVGQGTYVSAAK
jgi:hypothetical protein